MGCAVDVTWREGLKWSILTDFEPLPGVTVYSEFDYGNGRLENLRYIADSPVASSSYI